MAAKRPILIIEDDLALRQALVEHLSEDGAFQVIEATTLADALYHLGQETARTDLILLDVGLPDGDGLAFCAQLRRQGHHMPILMLTGATAEVDIVRGLENGANDYICKPFRVAELSARIRAQLRIHNTSENATFTVGPYIFRPAARIMVPRADGRKIHLTAKEVALLKYLLQVNGITVGRQALLDAVWGYSSGVSTHTLETHIYRLRQKLEADPGNPQLLPLTLGGYRLVADAKRPAEDHASNDDKQVTIRAA
jgi:DNA-binding response OmpR family regulator